jgi:uncharacterized protein with HEPN domain
MVELPERDAALLLDMLLAAHDAKGFVKELDSAAFLASRLHQNAAYAAMLKSVWTWSGRSFVIGWIL